MSDRYLALRDLLKQEAYSGLSDDDAAKALNEAATTRSRAIPAREVKRLWGQRMVLAAAKIASENTDLPAPLRVLCLATYDNLMGDLFNDLDPSDPTQALTITAFLDGLQGAGVLSEEVRAETLALASEAVGVPASLAWGGPIYPADVTAARKMEG